MADPKTLIEQFTKIMESVCKKIKAGNQQATSMTELKQTLRKQLERCKELEQLDDGKLSNLSELIGKFPDINLKERELLEHELPLNKDDQKLKWSQILKIKALVQATRKAAANGNDPRLRPGIPRIGKQYLGFPPVFPLQGGDLALNIGGGNCQEMAEAIMLKLIEDDTTGTGIEYYLCTVEKAYDDKRFPNNSSDGHVFVVAVEPSDQYPENRTGIVKGVDFNDCEIVVIDPWARDVYVVDAGGGSTKTKIPDSQLLETRPARDIILKESGAWVVKACWNGKKTLTIPPLAIGRSAIAWELKDRRPISFSCFGEKPVNRAEDADKKLDIMQ